MQCIYVGGKVAGRLYQEIKFSIGQSDLHRYILWCIQRFVRINLYDFKSLQLWRILRINVFASIPQTI